MPRNGAGQYNAPSGNPVVTDTTITSTWANSTVSDIGNELSNSLPRDGQAPPTANLPMGGFKHTGAANASASGEYTTLGQIQATTGAANVGADDGSSGSVFATVQGFITKILSSAGSSIVGFINSGVGAIKRSLQDKSREILSVKDFGAVGDGVVDDSAAIAAAILACPVGGTLVFPAGVYLTASTITVSKSIKILGLGSVPRQVTGGATVAAGVTWIYSGASHQLYIYNIGVAPLNGIIVDGIDFRPSVNGAAVSSVVFEANAQSIFGVRFINCHWQYFGKYAAAALSVSTGDVWDVAFENCGGSNNETSTTDMFSFFPSASGGAGSTGGFKISMIDCYFQSRAAGFYAIKAGSVNIAHGLIEVVRANALGSYSGGASTIVGTHYEANSNVGTVAITTTGDKSFIAPATIQTFATGVLASGTNTEIFPAGSSNTTDVIITSGGSRTGTVVYAGNQTVSNLRYVNDGVFDVLIFSTSDWNTFTPALKFGGNNVGMTGTFTGTRTRVGRLVTGTFEITLTSKGSSTGAATITGLQDVAAVYGSVAINYQANMNSAFVIQARVEKTQSAITLAKGNLATTTNMTDADFTATSTIYGSFSYSI